MIDPPTDRCSGRSTWPTTVAPQAAWTYSMFTSAVSSDRPQDRGIGVTTQPTRTLETIENPKPQRGYEIRLECPEFTCLCPRTGQPDFATIRLTYVPDRLCVELKSLKLYLWSFRDEGHFHEAVTNRILDDLVSALAPRRIEIEAEFRVRGGILTVVTARHPS